MLNTALENNRKKDTFFKASITVEASFIVPIVFCVIVMLMMIACYYYDRVVLINTPYYEGLKYCQYGVKDSDPETGVMIKEKIDKKGLLPFGERIESDMREKLELSVRRSLDKQLLFASVEDVHVEANYVNLEVTCSAKFKSPFGAFNRLLGEGSIISGKFESVIWEEEEVLRISKAIKLLHDKLRNSDEKPGISDDFEKNK